MAKDNAVRNQKVFVTLETVLKIQTRFYELVAEAKRRKDNPSAGDEASYRNQARGMSQVIKALDLPIEIPAGY